MDLFDKYVGRVFDNRYRIEKIIGIGGMAVVFEAEDTVMHRKVAVKMLKEEINNDAQSVKRFINESKAVSMLSHPNIVSIYDVSVKDNLKYIVMEHVEGITLKNYINTKKVLGTNEVISYAEQILRALEHAHSKGVIHRDIKPQNIMLLKNGQIKVADFGIAKLPNAETVTMTDKAIGTVFYISPEQASGKRIDPRSDLYSLGAVMYEMATGVLPFTADTPVSVALKHVNENARRPRDINPAIPAGLEQIIMGAMEKSPDERFRSASQMLKYILQLKANPGIIFKINKEQQKQGGNKTKENKKKSGSSMLPIISGVTTAFMLVLALSVVYVLTMLLSSDSSGPYTVTIDKYVGLEYNDLLRRELEDKRYYRLSVKYEHDPDVEAGHIISQTPEAGEKRKVLAGQQYCDLELIVSSGEESVVLRDLTVIDYRQAVSEIRSVGLIPEVVEEYNDTILEGYVIRTEPAAKTELAVGEKVVLYVSRGAEIVYTQVPDFRGMTSSEAMDALVKSDLGLGETSYDWSDSVAKGRIISQSRTPGSEVPKGTTSIDFVVSRGPEPRETQPETQPEDELDTGIDIELGNGEDTTETETETEAETKKNWYVGRN